MGTCSTAVSVVWFNELSDRPVPPCLTWQYGSTAVRETTLCPTRPFEIHALKREGPQACRGTGARERHTPTKG